MAGSIPYIIITYNNTYIIPLLGIYLLYIVSYFEL